MPIWLSITVILVSFYAMSTVVDGPFIKSLDALARRANLSSSVAGATLLALGTSAPEISTALVALFAEGAHPATGVGSIVGSAIFQVLVVVGFTAIVKAATFDWRPILRDSIFYAFSILLLIAFIWDDRFTVWEGAALVGAYVLYLGVMWIWTRNVKEDGERERPQPQPERPKPDNFARRLTRVLTWPVDVIVRVIPDPEKKPAATIPVFLLCLGLIGTACYWLVFAAEALAVSLSVPPAVIALTILAGGSSIPELISSATVSRQGRGDMAIANALGSNVFDVLMSLGLPVFLYCLMHGDLEGLGGANISSSIILLLATLVMVVGLLAAQRFRVGRLFGVFLVLVYVSYVVAAYMGWIG